MLDNLSILLTCGAIVLVAWRAIRLDAARPWFAPPPRPDARQPRR